LEVCNKGVCLPSASEGEGPGVRFGLRFDPIPGPSPSEGEGRIAFPKQILSDFEIASCDSEKSGNKVLSPQYVILNVVKDLVAQSFI